MIRRTLDSTRTDTRFPYTSLVRSAMQAAFRHLPLCIESRQVRPPVQIDDDAAARIMLRRHNRYWFPRDVDLQFQQPRVNRRELTLDELGGRLDDIPMRIIQAKPVDLKADSSTSRRRSGQECSCMRKCRWGPHLSTKT